MWTFQNNNNNRIYVHDLYLLSYLIFYYLIITVFIYYNDIHDNQLLKLY